VAAELLLTVGGAALFAELLRAIPENMRGRVSNTVIMAATGLAALAPLTAGLPPKPTARAAARAPG
jgi:hypothetical protein